jgi:hypothetical protein
MKVCLLGIACRSTVEVVFWTLSPSNRRGIRIDAEKGRQLQLESAQESRLRIHRSGKE